MILWVDDDSSDSLRTFIDELEENNYDVKMATDPDEMYKLLQENLNLITLIIMDIMLPTGTTIKAAESKKGFITGLALIRKLREEERYRHIPLIIFTIMDDQEVKAFAKANNIPIKIKQITPYSDLLKLVIELGIEPDNEENI